MIRLLLASYSDAERALLSEILARAQAEVENERCCEKFVKQYCNDCPNRHLCTDLLNASVFAADYTPSDK